MRGILHLAVAASVLLAFGLAPFAHRHDANPDHGHAGGEVHAHWPGGADHDEPEDAGWKTYDADSDAKAADWLAGDGKAPSPALSATAERIAVARVETRGCLIGELSPRSHDPPCLLRLQPRAPPV